MKGLEVFNRINQKKEEIEHLINPGLFILNKRIAEIYKEIDNLQNECEHEFKDGVCRFCGIEEKKEEKEEGNNE